MAAQFSKGQIKQCNAVTCDLRSAEQRVFFQENIADVTPKAHDLGQLAMLRIDRGRMLTVFDPRCFTQVPRAVAVAV